jgi:uncharacterized Zn-binding protein involved in type VI secretion
MRRYTITLGAPSTSGGKVISASSDSRIEGVAIALEGDLVSCPLCKTAGKIRCVGPRIPESLNGKNVALENDLCICRCSVPPKLLPNQAVRSQVIKDTGRALSNPAPDRIARGSQDQVFSDQFRLVDDHDGQPLVHREYAVVRASGKLEFGTSDDSGHTHVLSTTAQAEPVEIYAQGPMLTASLISPSGAVLHHRARRCTTPAVQADAKEVRLHLLQLSPQPGARTASPAPADELVVFLPESGAQ